MGCSHSVANRAHKIGLKLLEDSLEEEFLVAMLVSLSRLAAKSTLILSDQVNLLLSFLSPERSLQVQATALRCLKFIFKKVFCHSTVSTHVIKTLLRTIEETELPSAMQYEALQILQKILVYRLHDLPCDNMLEFTRLLNIFEKAAKSPIMSDSLLFIRVLVDASACLMGRTQIESDGDCFVSLPVRVTSAILDHIILLLKPLLDGCQNNSKLYQEFQSLLNLLFSLVRADPDLSVLALDKVGSLIGFVVDTYDSFLATGQRGVSVDELVNFGGQKIMDIGLNVLHNVHKFSVSCIENLNELDTLTAETIDKVKLLVERVQHCRLFDQYTYVIFSTLLHSQIVWNCVINKNEEPCIVRRNSGNPLCNQLVEYEILSLEHIEKMLTERNYWPAYKAGKFAVCQGAWVTASFVFGQLIGKVQSDSFTCWMKALAKSVESEGKIQLFLLPNLRYRLVDWLQMKDFRITFFGRILDDIGQCAVGNINELSYSEVLTGVHYGLCSSRETLKSIATFSRSYYFQRWFLAVRANILRAVVDVLKVLGTFPLIEGNFNDGLIEKGIIECLDSLREITQISFQLKSLAQELDLIATSFVDMDSRSSKIISALALSCSLLAFATGFALFISNLADHEILISSLDISRNYLQVMLIQNLVGRLWLVDQEICSKLHMLLDLSGFTKDCFHLQPRNQILNSGGEVRDILNICNSAVSGIAGLQNKTKGAHNVGILSHISKDGFQLVLKTLTKWIDIPFRLPKYFFKVRPCIGAELFVFNADSRNSNELTVLPGFHLSINLCLQLRNVPPNLVVQMKKLYCVLCSSASFREPKSSGETRGQIQLDYEDWEMSSMITMNEKLFRYVTETAKKTDKGDFGL
ncbi:hypothetical protein JCGZ_27114 [Jatropha curcas]|uniref:Uncharacterized protein n=1 Tax=Jatropha curcas TaxID=180498 RepID=A0A067JWI4_JATCU|nr:hypothetical protein JCGZ_27114 [Jatropha curcas]